MKPSTFSFARTTFAIVCLTTVMMARQARSEIYISVVESGGDVVVSGSGTLNVASLTPDGSNVRLNASTLNPELATFLVGSGFVDYYTSLNGPSDFGPGVLSFATTNSGNTFGVLQNGYGNFDLVVPSLYVSGASLSSSATYAGQTFNSLGLTPGTYKWTWGSGADADSITMQIGLAVPEPSSFVLFGLGAGPIAIVALRRAKGIIYRTR